MTADSETSQKTNRETGPSASRQRKPIHWTLLGLAFLLAVAGISWLTWAGSLRAQTPQQALALPVDSLTPGTVAGMDSPFFEYGPGWTISAAGADPGEPADPWHEPAGVVEFTYEGNELALQLATGDYWGYLYVTVDGAPASELPVIRGNNNSQGHPAGYKPLYDPDTQPDNQAEDSEPAPVWIRVHQAPSTAGPHSVRLEIWRGWTQRPLRAVAIDALPPVPAPIWPGAAMLVTAFWLAVAGLHGIVGWTFARRERGALSTQPTPFNGVLSSLVQAATGLATLGLMLATFGTATDLWFLCLSGVALLGLAALTRPALWIGALLFGLPFYFTYPLPLLPGRSFSLIDVGVFGGLVIWVVYVVLQSMMGKTDPRRDTKGHEGQSSFVSLRDLRGSSFSRSWFSPGWILAAIVSWALIAAVAAAHTDLALHEWRTVFLAGGIFALLLTLTLSTSRSPSTDRRLILWSWLAGATVVSLVGLWQFAAGSMLISAEGVQRIRAFYGSPNNLALYLERSLAVTLALGLFVRDRWTRIGWLILAGIQGAALLLTFSKGALLLALPVSFIVLWVGGRRLLKQRSQSTAPLWVLAALAAVAVLAVTPFLGTERFQRLLDFSQGTGFLRIQLWRSAWQMALDHLPFGVGPDNFLYAYRSGYILPEAWQEPNLNHPHNWLLDWWTRLGLVGLALGLGFWASGIARLWRRFRSAGEAITGEQEIWALGFLAASLAALAHGWIDLSYALPDLMIVWCTMFFLPGENE